MDHTQLTPVVLARATEQLRQERETFDQSKQHEARWFVLRLVMGYAAVILLTAVMVVASYVLFNAREFTAGVVTAAGAALFVDVLGLLIAVWKIALNPNFYARLGPVTRVDLPDPEVSGAEHDSELIEPLILRPNLEEVRARRSYEFSDDLVILEIQLSFLAENVSSRSVSNWSVAWEIDLPEDVYVTRKAFPKLGSGPSSVRFNSTILPTLSMTTETMFGLKIQRTKELEPQVRQLLEPAHVTYHAISDNHVGEDICTPLRSVIDWPKLCDGLRQSLEKEKILLGQTSG